MSDSLNRTQVLGGVLVVLSLALLYCWYHLPKNSRKALCSSLCSRCMQHSCQCHDRVKLLDSQLPDNSSPQEEAKQTENMNDRETNMVIRHEKPRVENDLVSTKWLSDANVAGESVELRSDGFASPDYLNQDTWYQQQADLIGGDIETPLKSYAVPPPARSLSGDLIGMTDNRPEFQKR